MVFLSFFFLSVAVGMLLACRLFQMRDEAKGIKKRDKIFKTLQLKDITFIHKLCMRGWCNIFHSAEAFPGKKAGKVLNTYFGRKFWFLMLINILMLSKKQSFDKFLVCQFSKPVQVHFQLYFWNLLEIKKLLSKRTLSFFEHSNLF